MTISAPYVFFSTRQVGVSLSRRAEGGKAIVGLDIVLDDLGRMLDELRITPSAELALVDGSGAVVAYRDPRVLTARALAAEIRTCGRWTTWGRALVGSAPDRPRRPTRLV